MLFVGPGSVAVSSVAEPPQKQISRRRRPRRPCLGFFFGSRFSKKNPAKRGWRLPPGGGRFASMARLIVAAPPGAARRRAEPAAYSRLNRCLNCRFFNSFSRCPCSCASAVLLPVNRQIDWSSSVAVNYHLGCLAAKSGNSDRIPALSSKLPGSTGKGLTGNKKRQYNFEKELSRPTGGVGR